MNYLFIAFLLSCSISAYGYVQNRSQSDAGVQWTSSVSLINIYVNTTNSLGLTSTDVNNSVTTAVAQWNGKSRITLKSNPTSNTNQEGQNEIYFSSDPGIFANGTGVVGVTQVLFKNNTGEIIEADILLNDSFVEFTTNKNSAAFLGNVITHEMGHFLGLGHSQVVGASMFYALSRGQSEISDDDKAGVYSIYPTGDSSKGSLAGKIVGGKSLASVFGAHVQAVSLKTGKVAAANISDIDGSFVIAGLSKDDQYFIYTSPIVSTAGLPARYSNAKFDFCNSSKKYRGSFFQACGAGGEGFPQSIKLNASQVQVGSITIRCTLDVPVDYIQNKSSVNFDFDLQSHTVSGLGNTFTGYFSQQEMDSSTISNPVIDKFRADFSNVNWLDYAPLGVDLYLELKVLNQAFFSPYKANVSIDRLSTGEVTAPSYVLENDGWMNIDTFERKLINRSNSSDNDFEISIYPESMKPFEFPQSLPVSSTKSDYFPSSNNFEDSLYFYLVSASIVKDNGNGTFSPVSYKSQQLTDNQSCPDAINTYALSTYSATGTGASTSKSSATKKKDGFLGCGTVDMSGGPGSGPGGFFIGLILSLILCSLTSSIIKQNKIKTL